MDEFPQQAHTIHESKAPIAEARCPSNVDFDQMHTAKQEVGRPGNKRRPWEHGKGWEQACSLF